MLRSIILNFLVEYAFFLAEYDFSECARYREPLPSAKAEKAKLTAEVSGVRTKVGSLGRRRGRINRQSIGNRE